MDTRWRDLQGGTATRREVLGGLAGAAMLAVAPAARAQEPKRGGRLRIGAAHGSTTDSLDPNIYDNGFTDTLSFAVNGFLTEIDTSGTAVPEIAESWESSPDAKRWVFGIRKGIQFHNGRTLTPDDVVASFNYHRAEGSKSAVKPFADEIADIAVDGAAVVFTLKAGNADFPYVVSDYHFAVMPKEGETIDWKAGIGAGPYALRDFDPGIRASLSRHANYWKPGRAHFDEIEILAMTDRTARISALASGAVDVIDEVPPQTFSRLQGMAGIKVHNIKGGKHYTFPMRTDVAPFNNNDVRLALKYAVDREQLLATVLSGLGAVGNDHPIGPSYRFHAADLPQTSYDPDRARQHLQKAGITDLRVDLHAADAAFPGAVDAASLFSENAKKAGITINAVRDPDDGYWSNVWMKQPWCASYWGGRATEDMILASAYQTGVSWNESFWSNAKFDSLLTAARTELDETKRAEMYHELQRILRDEGGTVIPVFADYLFATSDRFGHGEIASNFNLDGKRLTERWWFS